MLTNSSLKLTFNSRTLCADILPLSPYSTVLYHVVLALLHKIGTAAPQPVSLWWSTRFPAVSLKVLLCDQWNPIEQQFPVDVCMVCYAFEDSFNFWVCKWTPKSTIILTKTAERCFLNKPLPLNSCCCFFILAQLLNLYHWIAQHESNFSAM